MPDLLVPENKWMKICSSGDRQWQGQSIVVNSKEVEKYFSSPISHHLLILSILHCNQCFSPRMSVVGR